jgi:hypothetical protein
MALLGIDPAYLVAFFTTTQPWTLSWMLETFIQCDLPAVMTCSNHQRDLAMSVVVTLMLYVVVNIISTAAGFPAAATFFLIWSPWFILWYTFGMAPTCLPLVPPCLLTDVISLAESILPVHMTLPERLVCGTNNLTNATTCLRSCESELNFTSWEQPLAFSMCDTSLPLCEMTRGLSYIGTEVDRFSRVIRNKTEDLTPYRICTWVTFVSVIPVILLVISVFLTFSAIALGMVSMIQPLGVCLGNVYVYYWTS